MNMQEMLHTMTADNPELEKEVQDKLNKTRLIRCLIGLRAKAGMSQAEVARKMNCSQSRVSKIEHGFDEDITIGELNAYSRAVSCWFGISISDTTRNTTGLIKYHILQANELLKKIIQLADDDKNMLMGADDFSMEMLVNFCRLLENTTKSIPNSSFQKIVRKAQPHVPETFELSCNECLEKALVES